MTRLLLLLLTLLFSLSGPAMGGYSDSWQSSLAAKTALQKVVEGSRQEGKHLVYDLDDGGKVFMRKESHPLPDSGGADVPHWNIEVMRPRNDRLGKPLPGQYKPALDTHITLDPSGKPDGIFHTGPMAPKKQQ